MIELDQMVALSILTVTLPGAVITMHNGMSISSYSGFAGSLLTDMQIQGFAWAMSGSNITLHDAQGLAGSVWRSYELALLTQNTSLHVNHLMITRILAINRNIYSLSVPSNESPNLD